MKSKYFLIGIALMSLLLFGLDIVSAESGSITVQNITALTYQTTSAGQNPHGADDFTQFLFYSTGFNQVVNYTIIDTAACANYALESEYTTFTISSGGSGSGVASYSKYLKHLNWVFTPTTQITSSTFTVSYATNIFLNVTPGCTQANYRTLNGVTAASSTTPIYSSISGEALGNIGNTAGSPTLTHQALGVAASATNAYIVTYPMPGYFAIDVSKSGQTVATKDIVHGLTTTYQTETSFNTNQFSFFGAIADGIYLKVSLGTGDYLDVLINSTTPSGTIGAIQTDKTSYLSNETIQVTGTFTKGTNDYQFGFIDVFNNANPNLSLWNTYTQDGAFQFNITYLSDSAGVGQLSFGDYTIKLRSYSNGPGCIDTFDQSECYTTQGSYNFAVVPNSTASRLIYTFPTAISTGGITTVYYISKNGTDVIEIMDNNGHPYQSWTDSYYPNSHAVTIPNVASWIGTWTATITNATNASDFAQTTFDVVRNDGIPDNNYAVSAYWLKKSYLTMENAQLQLRNGSYTGEIYITIIKEDDPAIKTTTNTTGNNFGIQTIYYQFRYAGRYWANTYINNGTQLVDKSYVDITKSSTSTANTATSASKTTDDILGNGLYVALLILIMFAVMGHMIGGLGGAVIGFGSGFIMTAVYGFIPIWALFLFTIVVIVVLAILFGKNLTGSD